MQTILLTPYDNSLIGKYKSGEEIQILLDTTAASFICTLPDAFASQGTKFTFTVIGINNAIINPIIGQYINEINSITIAKDEVISVSSYEDRYYIFGKHETALIFRL